MRKLYLNAEGKRERIVPLWCDSIWLRKVWCLFAGHGEGAHFVIAGNRVTCGICCKILQTFKDAPKTKLNSFDFEFTEQSKVDLDSKSWLWNGEPVTWHEFLDRIEGKHHG